jgi:hypothetical protein
MRRGNFAGAWRVSDRVLRERADTPCWHLPRHEQYLWDGRSLCDRRVLVCCYHGLGDTVQFIRYAPLLAAQAREVAVWAQPSLVEILRGAAGVDCVLPLHDGAPPAAYDARVEIMELAHVFRSMVDTLPAHVPYLQVPAAARERAAPALDAARFHVGVAWTAGEWDPRRSVPLPLLAAWARIPGITLHAIQRGPALAEWRRAGLGPVSGSDEVVIVARRMQTLDLIISVDSFPAHLAGALGLPVWTLLHANPDWRWMEARTDSPWYPTMRLFRQERAGAWEPVVARVAAELRDLVSQRPAAAASGAASRIPAGEA